jgi:DNA-binding LacI/PurR family transcriptional regulator
MAGGEHVGAATRDDVARLAGVSSATVSRAYNKPSAVSQEKLALIRAAARSLGYKPCLNASGLRRKGSGTVLLLLQAQAPDLSSENRVYRWSYGEALLHAQAALADSCYRLCIGLWDDRKESPELFLSKNECDGVVLGLGAWNAAFLRAVKLRGIPYVRCAREDSPSSGPLCYLDERAGGRIAASSLLKAGRRRLAHISAELERVSVCVSRWEGFRARAREEGCEPLFIDGGTLGVAGGRLAASRLAPLVKRREVDGLFVVNDLTAVGVMQSLAEAGVEVPRELALVAYDNLPFRELSPIKMASVDVSIGRLYETAASLLLKMLRKEIPAGESVHEAIIPALVEGASLPLGGDFSGRLKRKA